MSDNKYSIVDDYLQKLINSLFDFYLLKLNVEDKLNEEYNISFAIKKHLNSYIKSNIKEDISVKEFLEKYGLFKDYNNVELSIKMIFNRYEKERINIQTCIIDNHVDELKKRILSSREYNKLRNNLLTFFNNFSKKYTKQY